MDRYLFPAVFEPGEKKGYFVSFPDLSGCITEGDSLEEALRMSKEALELHLYGMEEDGDIIPEPTPPEKLEVPEGSFVSLVEAWMDLVRDEMANKSIKKTLTVPKWLNDLAEQNRVNFSHVLQVSLKKILGVIDHSVTDNKGFNVSKQAAKVYSVGFITPSGVRIINARATCKATSSSAGKTLAKSAASRVQTASSSKPKGKRVAANMKAGKKR